MTSRRLVFLVLVLISCAACGRDDAGARGKGSQPGAVTVSSFDQLNAEMAKRVSAVLVSGSTPPDFQVVVTPAAYPIGTLLQKGRSYPYDDASCVPATEPAGRSMPNAFPSYQLDANVAAQFGLNESVLQGVANAGAGVARGASFGFSIVDPQLKVLSDAAIRQVFRMPSCTEAISADVVIVRGYVVGQRRFSARTERKGNAGASVAKVGNFTVEGSGSDVLSITDAAPEAFLQVLSEVAAPAPTPVAPRPAPAPAAPPENKVTAPTPVAGTGRIYVQQDRGDAPEKARAVVEALTRAGFTVEPRVEQIASTLMPTQPQVRYFRAGDEGKAMQVLATFRASYPAAVAIPLKIAAPPGQLEVWLPRVK